MSNTNRIHQRFWSAMAERYGRRWTDQYGPESSPAWRELIDKFTPEDVKSALGELPKEAKEFPPTLPQFEAILAKTAQRRKADPTDYARGYWRSAVVFGVAAELGHTSHTLEPFVVAHRNSLGAAMRELLDTLDTAEKRMGQRTEGLYALCRDGCKKIAATHWNLRHVA